MNKKLVLLGAGLLMTAATASAQKLVSGRVTDTHGEPVMGATVRVPGTKVITTTDANGNFKLKGVPATAKKISVSYIGMQPTTVSVAGNVQVVLKDNELGEAVVIGYGTAQKVGTVVGSVKKVGGEKVENNPTANVADALQGKVAGLQVLNNSGDAGDINNASIKLRGTGSFTASNTPLIVIDGSPAGTGMLAMLNDKDIESVTTLKDASATSIYGSRAANGVIFITTKKGRAEEKAQITISQSVGWSQLANAINNQMNSSELLQFQLENGIITPDQYQTYKLHGANTNWQKYYFDNAAPMYNTDFSLRGGSGNTTYFVSASYKSQNSLTKVGHLKRYTLRSNLDTKPKQWLNFGLKQSVAYTDRLYNPDVSREDLAMNTANAVCAAYMYPAYWDPYSEEAKKTHYITFANAVDPMWQRQMMPATINDIIYNGVAYAQIQPVKGLTIKSQLGLYASDSRIFEAHDPSIPALNGVGSASASSSRSSMWTITNTVEYKFNIGDKHAITLLAGQEGIKGSSKGFSASATGITDSRLLNFAGATTPNMPGYSSSKYEYLSFFGRADYALMNRYFFNFTVRNDKSSRFGADNRAANFLSGGVMWRLSDETFMAATKSWLTDLQVKYSVGSTGNSEIGNYSSLGLTTTTPYNGDAGLIIAQPSNKELGWEKQIQSNVGLTARLFDRVNIDVNYYNRKTKNMLMSTPLAYTTGFSSMMLNVGQLTNNGVEVEVSYDAFRSRDAFINIYANFAYNANKIDKLFNGQQSWDRPSYYLSYVVGKSINYYMAEFAGVDKNDGLAMWYTKGNHGNGKTVHEFNPETMTKTYSNDLLQDVGKSYYPNMNGGFGFTASWKGLSLNADFAFVLNKYMLNIDYQFSTNNDNAKQGFNQSRDMLKMWKKPGDITDIPGLASKNVFDSRVLQNASFLRLKNLTLSYSLPQQWMQATRFFDSVRIYATARNLFTATKYKGGDPEKDGNISVGFYPGTRQYMLGVEVSF
uniref:SusC/RagA family TonB-linked outer membrane protein n=1 Tax=Alloprevotella sp. TaxID=1872471 RepID=UPI003FD865BC